MAWTVPADRATGDVVTAAQWNLLLGTTSDLSFLGTHVHSGASGDGGSSLGPLVLSDFTDAAAPSAPSSGRTRLYSISGRMGARANGGSAKVLADQDTIESLTNKTLVAPTIASFANANHGHTDAAGGGVLLGSAVALAKAADEAVNNSATLQNDNDFVFAVGASQVWVVEMDLSITFGVISGLKVSWVVAAGTTWSMIAVGHQTQLGDATPRTLVNKSTDIASGTGATAIDNNGSFAPTVARLAFTLRVGGTGGTAQFQWAQVGAAVGDTKLLKDSLMVAFRVL